MREIKVTVDDIKKEIDSYILEKPGEKLSVSSLGKYMRAKGIDIEDHTIRRRPGIQEYIAENNSQNLENHLRRLVVYKTIDARKLINENRGEHNLEKAIQARDKYYQEVAASASLIFKENEKLKAENEKLVMENSDLKDELKKKIEKADRAENNEKVEIIRKLSKIIDNNINKEMANAILEREGILENVTSLLGQETIDGQIVTADTNVEEYVQDKLMEIFD